MKNGVGRIERKLLDDRSDGKTKEIKNAGRAEAKRNMLELIQDQQEAGELDEPKKSYAEKSASQR